ncbi:MAG TPA: glycosyltransferase [Phycicoccus sp.]
MTTGRGRAGGRPRVVLMAPVPPHDRVTHAGGVHLRAVYAELERRADVTVVVPDTPATRKALERPGLPERLVVVGRRSERGALLRPLFRALAVVDGARVRRDPSRPSLVAAAAVLTSGPARRALADADVVDLEWSETARLARVVRWLAPRARLVATLHDVRSQAFARRADLAAGRERTRLRRAERREARAERRLLRRVDRVVTLSAKDVRVLTGADTHPRVRVLHPPLAGRSPVARHPATPSVVLFVGDLSRAENESGLTWFLDEVWPGLVAAAPVRLRVVGAGATEALRDRVSRAPQADLAGWVESLDEEYATAALSVVPLRAGAGVKFKTIEALVAGVPVVTTSIGAEGIGGPEVFAGLHDEAPEFRAACLAVLREPDDAERAAATTRGLVRERYSREGFTAAVAETYLSVTGTGRTPP